MRRIAIGFVAAAMVFAACGGSSKSSSSGSGTTNGKSTGNATNTTASGGSSGGGNSSLQDLSKVKIKITYAETGSSGSGTNLTIAQDGNGKSSFSTTDSSTGSSSDSSSVSTIYSDGKSTVECQGTGSSAQCTSVPAAGAALGSSITTGFATIASLIKILGNGDKSSDNIAGRDAECHKYKASNVIGKLAAIPLFKDSANPSDYDPNDTANICIDKKTGFPLKFSGTKKGVADSVLTATSVGDPSDSDFTPPVTPQTIPGGITVPTSGG